MTAPLNRPSIEPYPGPRPFTAADAAFFTGRAREIADVLTLLASYRLVFLYGVSGVGTSSLTGAGMRARLEHLESGDGEEATAPVPAKLRNIPVVVGRVSGVASTAKEVEE